MTKIIVLVSTFNCIDTIEACLRSCVDAKYVYKVLIKDGGSDDGTINLIKKLSQKHPRICLVSHEPDSGIYDAWNYLIKYIQEYKLPFCFLGGDDLLNSKTADSIPELSQGNILSYGVSKVSTDLSETISTRFGCYPHWEKHSLLQVYPPFQGLVFPSECANKTFSTKYNTASDTLWLHYHLQSNKLIFINDVLCKMRLGGVTNQSGRRLKKINEHYQVLTELTGFLKSSYRLLIFVFNRIALAANK